MAWRGTGRATCTSPTPPTTRSAGCRRRSSTRRRRAAPARAAPATSPPFSAPPPRPAPSPPATAPPHRLTVGSGSYALSFRYAGDDQFNAATGGSTLTVNPAPLTITADDQAKVAGDSVPTLTASYAGFVNGDDASSLSTPVSLS